MRYFNGVVEGLEAVNQMARLPEIIKLSKTSSQPWSQIDVLNGSAVPSTHMIH